MKRDARAPFDIQMRRLLASYSAMASQGTGAASERTYAVATSDKLSSTAGNTRLCILCTSEGNNALDCKKHKLCQKCLRENVIKYGAEAMFTCPANECAVVAAPSPPIWIYVDNSNIWIGAKYLASKVKGFKSSQDRRVRISIGNLTDVVAKSRDVRKGTLYGSEPPKIDSVWEKIRQHKCWEVKTKQKSFLTHKEKEVDAQLLVDVTKVACTTPLNERGTIILITGDADMCPAVEGIMECKGWNVEIYMWEKNLSERLKALSRENADVICEPLDNHMRDIVFTNNKFPATDDNIPKECSAVLTIEQNVFPKRIIDPTGEWWLKLEKIIQWPAQYGWLTHNEEETNDLLLVFNHFGEKETFDVSDFVQKMSDHEAADPKEHLLPHVVRAETYIAYKKRLKAYDTAIVKYGHFSLKDIDCESVFFQNEAASVAGNVPVFCAQHVHVVDDSPYSGNCRSVNDRFKSVPPTSQIGGQHKNCLYEKNCRSGLQCKFAHSESDKAFFRWNGGKGMPKRKTEPCNKYPNCPYNDCNYAHGDRDAWCLICRKHGHFTKKCTTAPRYR